MKKIILLVGPSGSGKTTILNNIVKTKEDYSNLISFTTRKMRSGEKENVDYVFVSNKYFNSIKDTNKLIEYAEFNGNIYGKRKNDLETLFNKNQNIITIVESKGVLNFMKEQEYFIKKGYILEIIFLDINKKTIKERMLLRGDKEEDINNRLENNDFEYFQPIKKIANKIIKTDNKTIKNIIKEVLL